MTHGRCAQAQANEVFNNWQATTSDMVWLVDSISQRICSQGGYLTTKAINQLTSNNVRRSTLCVSILREASKSLGTVGEALFNKTRGLPAQPKQAITRAIVAQVAERFNIKLATPRCGLSMVGFKKHMDKMCKPEKPIDSDIKREKAYLRLDLTNIKRREIISPLTDEECSTRKCISRRIDQIDKILDSELSKKLDLVSNAEYEKSMMSAIVAKNEERMDDFIFGHDAFFGDTSKITPPHTVSGSFYEGTQKYKGHSFDRCGDFFKTKLQVKPSENYQQIDDIRKKPYAVNYPHLNTHKPLPEEETDTMSLQNKLDTVLENIEKNIKSHRESVKTSMMSIIRDAKAQIGENADLAEESELFKAEEVELKSVIKQCVLVLDTCVEIKL